MINTDYGGFRLQLGAFACIIFVLAISSLMTFASADNMNAGVFSKDSKPYSIHYGEWIAKWWQWNQGIPSIQHPRDNYSPEKCVIHQSGPVWFLADILTGKEERTCTIPSGKAVLVPLLTGMCDNDNTDPKLKTDVGLRDCATAGDDFGVISASLDGKKLQNLDQYRTQSGFFNITISKDNIFNNIPG